MSPRTMARRHEALKFRMAPMVGANRRAAKTGGRLPVGTACRGSWNDRRLPAIIGRKEPQWQSNPKDRRRIFPRKSRTCNRAHGLRKFRRIRMCRKRKRRLWSGRILTARSRGFGQRSFKKATRRGGAGPSGEATEGLPCRYERTDRLNEGGNNGGHYHTTLCAPRPD